MAKTAYDILGLSPSAPNELISPAHDIAVEALARRVATGSADARNELVAVKEAFRLLSSPERRREYDRSLLSVAATAVHVVAFDAGDEPRAWWKSTWFAVGMLTLGVAFASQRWLGSQSDSSVNREAAKASSAALERQQQLQEQAAARQAVLDDMRAKELETRTRQAQEQADRAHWVAVEQRRAYQEREATVARAQEQAQRERLVREEATRIERERRYYTCVNTTYGPTVSMDRARQMCGAYR